MTVRVRLALWHSSLLALIVVGFAIAAYAFLRQTELRRIDSMMHEQSEIVGQTLRASGFRVNSPAPADTERVLNTLHDLRARGLRAWVVDSMNRPIVSTAMVYEGEGPGEERRVLGDSLPSRTFQSAAQASHRKPLATSVATADGDMRLLSGPLPPDLGRGATLITYSLRDLNALLARARMAAIVAVLLALLLSAGAGYALARQSLAPVAEMSRQADRIGADTLHDRLTVANPHDELGALASTFNRLIDRVGDAFEQQRRFMADASHELRTPVAIMRGEAEIALSEDTRTREEYRDALRIVRDASQRMTRVVNDIFLLARVDAGQVPTTPAALYLDDLVAETCRAVRSLAAAREIELRCHVPADIQYVGDEKLLERLITNLIDNAIKYSDDGGIVDVSLSVSTSMIRLDVSNGGPGIPPEARAHVFERFFRADAARSRVSASHGSGSGLGLSIARWIAELHGGSLDLSEASTTLTVLRLQLPLEPVMELAVHRAVRSRGEVTSTV